MIRVARIGIPVMDFASLLRRVFYPSRRPESSRGRCAGAGGMASDQSRPAAAMKSAAKAASAAEVRGEAMTRARRGEWTKKKLRRRSGRNLRPIAGGCSYSHPCATLQAHVAEAWLPRNTGERAPPVVESPSSVSMSSSSCR